MAIILVIQFLILAFASLQNTVAMENRDRVFEVFSCAMDGNIDELQMHLSTGFDVNTRNHLEQTLLHAVIVNDYLYRRTDTVKTITLLIDSGADVNEPDKMLDLALFLRNSDEVIRALLDAGADISIPNFDGLRPMDNKRLQKIILHQRLPKVMARLRGKR